MKKHIYLTGFMGAGKSKIGRLLSKKFDWSFFDTDDEIEKLAGKSVKDIFEEEGEPAFRQKERACIQMLAKSEIPSIIALGGGALMDEQNFRYIINNGLLIYIKSSPEQLYERTKNSSKRPLLQKDEKENMLRRIRALLNERSPVYEKADLVFNRDGLSLDELIQNLYKEINQRWS